MKFVAFVAFFVAFIVGCAGFQIAPENEMTVATVVRASAREIGCEVKMNGSPEIDLALRNLYESVQAGTLTDEAVIQLSQYMADRPTLGFAIQDLLGLLSVNVTPDGVITEPIPESIMKAIAVGYQQGYNVCKAEVP